MPKRYNTIYGNSETSNIVPNIVSITGGSISIAGTSTVTGSVSIVIPKDFFIEVEKNNIPGHSIVKKFGRNTSVATTWSPVCIGGIYQTPTGATTLEFVSSDVNDCVASTGMHEIVVEGLDANWVAQTQTMSAHSTSGTTAVSVSGTWTRVFRSYVSKTGTYATQSAGSHAGTITVREAGGGSTWGTISIDTDFPLGQTLIGAYTIPSNSTGYIYLTSITADSGKTINMAFFKRENANVVTTSYTGVMRIQTIFTGISGGTPFNKAGEHFPLGGIPGPADIGFLARGASNPDVAVEFEILLVAD